jgi:hypothetical protein
MEQEISMYDIYIQLKKDEEYIQNKDTIYSGHIDYLNAMKPLIEYFENVRHFTYKK